MTRVILILLLCAAAPAADARAPTDADTPEDATIRLEPESAGVVIPPRPDWVEGEPVRTGPVHTIAVSSGPEEHEQDCRGALDAELEKAVAAYVDDYLGPVRGGRFKASTFIHYDAEQIRQRLVKPENIYHEVVQVSFGPMHQVHALVEFDEAFRNELDRRRGDVTAMGRVTLTALGLGCLLAALGVVCGYFRADTATRGHYKRRLQFAAAIAILSLIAAGGLLTRQMLW